MTELTITPKVSDKTARFKGTIAAGEHVAVTIKGGAECIGEDEGANLTLRVIDLVTKRTLAVFPRPPEVMDEGAEPDAWGSSGDDLTCTLNLNSDRMVAAARHMLRVPVMFVLGDTDAPRTLYFRDQYEVEYWPERIGDDVPYDLDAWPKQIDEWMELVDEWTELMEAWSTALAGKQDTISDLDTIRAGAAKGATAIQSHQDISGKADLVGGKVPQSQLPSYVDDVLEFAAAANFPATGEEGKIYVAKDENKTYRWSGTGYVQVGGSDITIDSALSGTSTNPVQNKVVTGALAEKLSRAEAEAGFTEWVVTGLVDGERVYSPPSFVPGTTSQWFLSIKESVGAISRYMALSDDGKNATNLVFNGNRIAATRTRLPTMNDIPTKTSALMNDGHDGEHPFISQDEVQHQQLALRGPNHDGYSAWTFTFTLTEEQKAALDADSNGLASEGGYVLSIANGSDLYVGNYLAALVELSADGLTAIYVNGDANIPLGEGATAATRTVLPGYVLGTQTGKPLQPQGDYAPATNIPKSALASDVQTSLGLAKTALQEAEVIDPTNATASGKAADALAVKTALAGKMSSYPFDSVTPTQTGWALPASAFPIFSNDGEDYTVTSNSELTYTYKGSYITVRPADHPLLVYDSNGENGSADGVGPIYFAYGEAGETQTVPDLDRVYTATVSPYTVTTYTATSAAAAFEIAIGALPTGVTGKARDCILVIDCTATGAVAPTVTWGTHFHPRTDVATDLAIVEAGKRAVFYISEYAAGEFAVGGWQETAGGSGT